MRILHVTPCYEPAWHLGGIVRSVGELCRGLAALGHEVTVYTTESGGDRRMLVPIDGPIVVDNVTVRYFPVRGPIKYAYSRDFAKACAQDLSSYDLVHIASFWNYPAIPAARVALKHRVPYMFSPHGSLTTYGLGSNPLIKRPYFYGVVHPILKRAACIHYTSTIESTWGDAFGLQRPSVVIPNGLDFQEFDDLPSRPAARRTLELPDAANVVLYMGRLNPRKGVVELIRGFARYRERSGDKDSVLLLAGPDDGCERDLLRLIDECEVKNRVRLLGFVDAGRRRLLLAASDLLALVARPGENFGNAVVEAMAAGLPVLISPHVGISQEILEDGSGDVCDVDEASIGQALEALLGNPDRLMEMSRCARASAHRRFDIRMVAAQMVEAYQRVVDRTFR